MTRYTLQSLLDMNLTQKPMPTAYYDALQVEADRERLQAMVRELREALQKYGHRAHYYCEDCWYSCPKATDGCCDDHAGDDCRCGADKHNAEVDHILVRAEALADSGECSSAAEVREIFRQGWADARRNCGCRLDDTSSEVEALRLYPDPEPGREGEEGTPPREEERPASPLMPAGGA